MEISGKIKLINDTQVFDSGFQKREFVVTTNEQYPQDIKLECIKDRVSILDAYSVGDNVKVAFNLRGNEYNGRYFVNLQAWRMEGDNSANTTPEEAPMPVGEDLPVSDEQQDDLPF